MGKYKKYIYLNLMKISQMLGDHRAKSTSKTHWGPDGEPLDDDRAKSQSLGDHRSKSKSKTDGKSGGKSGGRSGGSPIRKVRPT